MKSTIVLFGSIIAAIAVVGIAFVFLRPTPQADLPITLEEYYDPNCIHCRDFHTVSKNLADEFGEDLEIIYTPHPFLGNSSFQAVYAIEAAREQDAYVPYLDLIFENFERREDEDYIEFAKELELDIEEFNQDRESAEIQDRVAAQLDQNEQLGVSSTPTIYLEGNLVLDRSVENMRTEIQELIELAESQAAEQE